MATELELFGAGIGAAVYAVLFRDSDGLVANQDTEVIEEAVNNNYPLYAISLVESPAGSNHFVASVPSWMRGTRFNVVYYLMLGSEPHVTDAVFGGEVIDEFGIVTTSEPGLYPVTLAEQKAHCRIDSDVDDELLVTYIAAATEYIQERTGQQLLVATKRLYLDSWPVTNYIRIPVVPLRSVESVSYYVDGVSTPISLDDLVVDSNNQPGRVISLSGYWPSSDDRIGGIIVEYIAGYDTVPFLLKQGIKMLAAHFYENREATAERKLESIPFAVESIITMNSFPSVY